MNNKELQVELAKRLSITQREASDFINSFVSEYTSNLEVYEDAQIPFLKMGNMTIKKKDQRVIVNPVTKLKMLVPPKLSMSFKPSSSFKAKIKNLKVEEEN